MPEPEGNDEIVDVDDGDDDGNDDPLGRVRSKSGEGGGGKTWNDDEDDDSSDGDDDGDDDEDKRGAFFSSLNLMCAQLLGDGLPNDDGDGNGDGADDFDVDEDLDDLEGGDNKLGFTADDVEGAQDTKGLMSSCSVDDWLDALFQGRLPSLSIDYDLPRILSASHGDLH